ncbi:hypothetical protein B0A49_08964 [Cryomyces minteri]|uniref:Ubiquitin-like protease family profile domain-containing protein n=1 Tax=Cryomyces minteri TaxID=331657 RepID=A0A4V5NDE5_9PEZI|nr:hypothetical protein B0A49_08964 [Cryomyces minteri]
MDILKTDSGSQYKIQSLSDDWETPVEMLLSRILTSETQKFSGLGVGELAESLVSGGWMRDDVVSAYVKLLAGTCNEIPASRRKVAVLPMEFFEALDAEKVHGKLQMESVLGGTSPHELLSMQRLIVPIFLVAERHYVLVVVQPPVKQICLLDTDRTTRSTRDHGMSQPHTKVANWVKATIGRESWDGWVTVVRNDAPQQPIAGDCGPAMLFLARLSMVSTTPTTTSDELVQGKAFGEQIERFRKRIAAELLAEKLNPDSGDAQKLLIATSNFFD